MPIRYEVKFKPNKHEFTLFCSLSKVEAERLLEFVKQDKDNFDGDVHIKEYEYNEVKRP